VEKVKSWRIAAIFAMVCSIVILQLWMLSSFSKKNVAAGKKLAELLVGEHIVRLAIINAVLREVATKSNPEKLRGELNGGIERLREEFRGENKKLGGEFRGGISMLEQHIDGLERGLES